jgi:predicted dehydrogenase
VAAVGARVALLGAGFISDYHITGLREAGADVVALFSRSLERARAKAAQHGIRVATDRYADVLARDDVDAVVVATPDFTHEELTVAAVRAGKPVLVQKPMARTAAECRRMIRAAEAAGVVLAVAFAHRYLEEAIAVRELLAQEALGRILHVRHRNATPGADWAAWFYSRAHVGGGALMQLGIHGIDLLRHLFGEIEAVRATTATTVNRRVLADGTTVTPDNEDLVAATYRLRSGVTVTHEVSYAEVAGTSRFRMEIYGEAGTAWLRSERGRLAVYAPRHFRRAEWVCPALDPENPGLRQHRHFIDIARGEASPDRSDRDGLASVLVAEAVYRAAAQARWETVETPDRGHAPAGSGHRRPAAHRRRSRR